MKEHNSVILMSFECARRGKEKNACCNVQNEVRRPSMTDSGGQDGVFRGANTGHGGPKRASSLPIRAAIRRSWEMHTFSDFIAMTTILD